MFPDPAISCELISAEITEEVDCLVCLYRSREKDSHLVTFSLIGDQATDPEDSSREKGGDLNKFTVMDCSFKHKKQEPNQV